MCFHKKIDLFQARAVKYFIKNWMILTSDRKVLEKQLQKYQYKLLAPRKYN